MAAVVNVFLADPIHTSVPLPPFDPRRVRHVYQLTLEFAGTAADVQILDEAFQILNMNHPAGYGERSLSVGDVLTIDDSRSYVCDWTGWTLLSSPLRPGDLVARVQPALANSDLPPVPA